MRPFERAFRQRYQDAVELSAAAVPSLREAAELDHPSYTDLDLGEHAMGEAAIFFLDIRGYTRLAMAFAKDPRQTAKIVDAVVGGAVEALPAYGGHINDFTGDGVMAIFGDQPGSLERAHHEAVFAAVDLMTDMSATLREELLGVAIKDPVQVAIGLVSGPVLWKRVGTESCNRIMALGEVAPLAAKYVSSESTLAWQTMIGGDLIGAVPAEFRERVEDYERDYEKEPMKRERWLLNTEKLFARINSAEDVETLRQEEISRTIPPLPPPITPPSRHGPGVVHERTTG